LLEKRSGIFNTLIGRGCKMAKISIWKIGAFLPGFAVCLLLTASAYAAGDWETVGEGVEVRFEGRDKDGTLIFYAPEYVFDVDENELSSFKEKFAVDCSRHFLFRWDKESKGWQKIEEDEAAQYICKKYGP
jgi:hypothetical protein